MPADNHSFWAPIKAVATILKNWADGTDRPQNGSFAILKVKNGIVLPEFVWTYLKRNISSIKFTYHQLQ